MFEIPENERSEVLNGSLSESGSVCECKGGENVWGYGA